MTLSNNQCKHFYIRRKLIQQSKENDLTSILSKNVDGSTFPYRHAGVQVHILYVAVHIQGINMTPRFVTLRYFFLLWGIIESLIEIYFICSFILYCRSAFSCSSSRYVERLFFI